MSRPRMKPGEHGEIAMVPRADGTWLARTYVRNADGRRPRIAAVGPTKGAAKRALERKLEERQDPGTGSMGPTTTVSELATFWLQHRAVHGKSRGRGSVRKQTLAAYNDAITCVVLPALGELRLSEVTVNLLDSAFGKVETGSDGGGPRRLVVGRSTMQARSVMTQMLDLAVRYGGIPSNPMLTVEPTSRPTRRGRDLHHLTVTQAIELRGLVRRETMRSTGRRMPNRDLEEWVDVVLGTGCRNGEVLALRWLDLDLVSPTPTAHVCGTVVEPRGDYVKHVHRQGETKSSSVRTLILPQHLVGLLAARAERAGHARPEDPVFATAKGNWISPANIRARLRRAVAARPDLRGTSPHTLRRTVGTLVAHESGLDAARDQLGHSDPSVTFQHYVARRTVAPDLRDILDAFFGPRPSVDK